MFSFLFIQFIIILINILYTEQVEDEFYYMNSNCKREMKNLPNFNTYLNDSNTFILEIMRGKIPLKYEESPLNQFDLNLIKRINKNIPCIYLLKKDFQNNKINGIYLGAGINLLNYDYNDMEQILFDASIYREKEKYLKLIQIIKEDPSKAINETSFYNPFKDIDKFNLAAMKYTINKYMREAKDNKLYKSSLKHGILSVYFQSFQGENNLQKYLGLSASYTSLIIEHLPESCPYARFIQSRLILMDGTIRYNSNHIFLVVPLFLFDEYNLNVIKDLTIWLFNSLNNNNDYSNVNRISLLTLNHNHVYSNYIINFNIKKDSLDSFFFSDYKNKTEFIDLDEIYQDLNNKYNKNIKSDLFENKIVILFLNYLSKISEKHEEIIEKYKNFYGIQTIPIINIGDTEKKEYNDIFKYNLFYNLSDSIYVGYLKLALSHMHININLRNENENEKKVQNLNLNDIDVPMYIEVYINEGVENFEFYEISFEIKKTSGYNIFISDKNPYPNIRDNTNSFIKYENNLNPILLIKSFKINAFYIAIEGKLFFDIVIKRKCAKNLDEFNKLIFNKGEYEYINYENQFQLGDKHITIQTFPNNYTVYETHKLYSNIFKNETTENLMKYFTRGIDLYNTNDKSFFNYELFLFIFGETHLINRVYKDQNNNYYFGRYIKISEYTPYLLKNEGVNRLTINKIYPFLNIDNVLLNQAPPIYFSEEELITIYDISYKDYINELINKIKKYPNCIPFEEQSPSMKFILFILYFTYYYDSNVFKHIINLSLKEPKYSEVLKYIKDKKQESDLFLLNYISQKEQEDKLEKIMVSIILGKSLAITDAGINFINNFYNEMSKSKTKISVSIYDTLKYVNKIKNISPFLSIYGKAEDIINYNKTFYNERDKYNNTQYMDFNIITNFGLFQFSKYDSGIKKKILILCDENIKTNDNYIINNKLININDAKHINLIDNEIDIIFVTSKNYERGEIPELFNKDKLEAINKNKLPYTLYDNYFHVNNLNNIDEYLHDLGRIIKESPIKINAGKRFINDYYQGKISYYEINYKQYLKDVIVIKTNLSNFNFYSSLTNPFPNSHVVSPIEKNENDDAIVISNELLNGLIYLGIEPINSLQKQKIEIFSCESYLPNKNCKFIGNSQAQWLSFFFLFFVFSLFFIIYKCKQKVSSNYGSRSSKRLNVFDNVS